MEGRRGRGGEGRREKKEGERVTNGWSPSYSKREGGSLEAYGLLMQYNNQITITSLYNYAKTAVLYLAD